MKKEDHILNSPETDLITNLAPNEIICLMGVYLGEWEHRNDTLLKQIFTYFYATLIVILLPNISEVLNVTLPDSLPRKVFPLAGAVLALIFLYISLGYAVRLDACGRTYKNLINMLEPKYRRVQLVDIKPFGKLFEPRLTYFIPCAMFLILLLLVFVMLFYT